MSLNLEPTVFKNVRQDSETFGYRCYDEYLAVYENNWESIPDNDMEFLADVVEDCNNNSAPDGVKDALEHCKDNEVGLTIGGQYYDFEEILEVLKNLN